MREYAYIDFEFFDVTEEILQLVCCTVITKKETKEFWLFELNSEWSNLSSYLQKLRNEGHVCVPWQAVAEARSIYSLKLNPMDFEWIDLFLEYRCLTNHNDELLYGKQLVNGKVKNTKRPPPFWERDDNDELEGFKPTHSLAEATYKLTGQIRDTEEKNAIRDIIISGDSYLINRFKDKIMAYCTEDVKFLSEIHEKCIDNYKKLLDREYDEESLIEEMLYRGKYQALTAIRESKGYPIDYQKTKNFSKQVPLVLEACQRDINSQFNDMRIFIYDSKEKKFKWNQNGTREWIKNNSAIHPWPKTKKKKLSLKKEAFEKAFSFRHHYPRGNLGAQILRYLKLKQSLNGFTKTEGRKYFWDFVGRDKVVRPYMNAYGSQSSRTQPSATGFMMLKPAWTRALVQPPPGKVMTSIDYGSEEFLISGLMSGDMTMINSYLSGDVYLAFAKEAGMVPLDGKREDYKEERNLCKSTVLGISYDMTKTGLSKKLSADTGRVVTEEEAQDMINLFEEVYCDFVNWKKDVLYTYHEDGRLQLADGWYMWGDNDNDRSVGNCPIQGMGACIMRKADFLCYDNGLEVSFTLHDALYILHDEKDLSVIDTAMDCMKKAFQFFFDGEFKELAGKVRLDPETWGPGMTKGHITTPKGLKVPSETIHIDERAIHEYNQFSKYFESDHLEEIF